MMSSPSPLAVGFHKKRAACAYPTSANSSLFSSKITDVDSTHGIRQAQTQSRHVQRLAPRPIGGLAGVFEILVLGPTHGGNAKTKTVGDFKKISWLAYPTELKCNRMVCGMLQVTLTKDPPMKKAIVVVGQHRSGKSKTIKKYFKPLIGLSGNQRTFHLYEKNGMVLSQSLEEKRLGRVISQSLEEKRLPSVKEFLSRYLFCDWLVLAARPATEVGSHLKEILSILKENEFSVHIVTIEKHQAETFYEQRAKEILDHLSLN